LKFKNFIEDNFLIDNEKTSELVPFHFRLVQQKYYEQLLADYDETKNFTGLREIILKARKEGFTSLILALFCADIIFNKNPVRYLEISYKDDATKQHFRRAKNFILSCYEKNPQKWNRHLENKIFKSINEGSEFVLRQNGASFYVGTASARTGERGGTVQGVLFSESAFYPDTGIITAKEIIEGTRNMVAVGSGMIFQESTANSFNYFKRTWDLARAGQVDYHPRFFSWKEFYTSAEFEIIKQGFTDKALVNQEYPENEIEAFIFSGRTYFDSERLKLYLDNAKEPGKQGYLKREKDKIQLYYDKKGELKIWQKPQKEKSYIAGVDVAEGLGQDFSVAVVLDHLEKNIVATLKMNISPNEFGKELSKLGEVYNDAFISCEVNNHGLTTLITLKEQENYNNLYYRRTVDKATNKQQDAIGWKTTETTRPLMLDCLANYIRTGEVGIPSKDIIAELMAFVIDKNGKPGAQSGTNDDFVIALAIALYTLPFAEFMEGDTDYIKKYNRQGDMQEYGRTGY